MTTSTSTMSAAPPTPMPMPSTAPLDRPDDDEPPSAAARVALELDETDDDEAELEVGGEVVAAVEVLLDVVDEVELEVLPAVEVMLVSKEGLAAVTAKSELQHLDKILSAVRFVAAGSDKQSRLTSSCRHLIQRSWRRRSSSPA